MGSWPGARSYREQHREIVASGVQKIIDGGKVREDESEMTTDPEEGRRQIEAMKPEPLKVGDKVRLSAGGQVMQVFRLEDYGNMAECQWWKSVDGEGLAETAFDTFPVHSLVRVE